MIFVFMYTFYVYLTYKHVCQYIYVKSTDNMYMHIRYTINMYIHVYTSDMHARIYVHMHTGTEILGLVSKLNVLLVVFVQSVKHAHICLCQLVMFVFANVICIF